MRERPLEVRGKTGIRAFIAIRVLLSKKYKDQHDLESFFQVLFQIYIYYIGLNQKRKPILRFNKWNFIDLKELAKIKKGEVDNKEDFHKSADNNFLV